MSDHAALAATRAPVITPAETMRWVVRFDARKPFDTLTAAGRDCDIVATASGKEALVGLPHGKHVLVAATATGARITAGTSLFPVHCRIRGDAVSLSNRAMDLLEDGEALTLDTFVLLQQLLGANYPQYNVFADLTLLEAHGEYDVSGGALRYVRTTLLDGEQTDGAGALGMLYDNFTAFSASGRPLCVLISGGYDSRFNLAIAMDQAKRHGNEIRTFHEYKDDEEYQIAKAVAERAGVAFHCEPRKTFAREAEETIFDPGFRAFHTLTYRDNIPRWHGYLQWIRDTVPGGIIVGHGAEGHKGKFYGQVMDPGRDSEAVFGADPARIGAAARALGLRGFDRGSQRRFFSELLSHADQFDNRFSQVDFVHYHTYVVNGYAHRTYNFQQFFGVPFPLADNRFLATVFALPVDMKRGFKLVHDGLAQLAPALTTIPYTSGNAKSLKTRSAVREIVRRQLTLVRQLRASLSGDPGRRPLPAGAMTRLHAMARPPRSDITQRLWSVLEHPPSQGVISLTYVLQAFLYLRLLEEEKRVTFTCV